MTELVVESCDPSSREEQIKELFARNGQPQFAAAFDRAYRARAAIGLRSWLGRLGDRLVMHVSVSPVRFRLGDRTVLCGVMGDLMVEEAQRDFWAPVRLLRTVVADLKKEGHFDFLLTTTTSEAEAVFKAAGYKPYGSLRRFVLPLNAAYLTFASMRGRVPRLAVSGTGARRADASGVDADGLWRPEPTDEYYGTRLAREEFREGTWLTIGEKAGATGSVLLSTQENPHELNFADAFWSGGPAGLAPVSLAAARWARRQKMKRLSATILAESRAATQLVRAGFIPRAIRSTMLVQKLRAVPPADDLLLTGLSLSSW